MQSQVTGADTPPTRLLPYIPSLTLLALVITLATIGATQAVSAIIDSIRHGRLVAVGQPIRTSFGTLTVVHVETLAGLTADDLAGMTHGVQNLVRSNAVQVQIFLQLTNRTTTPAAYSPAQFKLLGAPVAIDPAGGTLQTGRLPGQATLNVEIDFVTPRTNRPLWLVYQDPQDNQTVRIAIGPADPNAGEFPPDPEEDHPSADGLPAPPNIVP